jgi:hypothetical protein
MSKCEVNNDQSANRIRRANMRSTKINLQTGLEKQMCEINKDQSANSNRKANVRSTKINLQTGSEEQM